MKKRETASSTVLGEASGVGRRRVALWNEKKMAAMQAAGVWWFGGRPGTYIVASDGARIGRPAKEMVVYECVNDLFGNNQYLPLLTQRLVAVDFVRRNTPYYGGPQGVAPSPGLLRAGPPGPAALEASRVP